VLAAVCLGRAQVRRLPHKRQKSPRGFGDYLLCHHGKSAGLRADTEWCFKFRHEAGKPRLVRFPPDLDHRILG
jgi:hypothetical protein